MTGKAKENPGAAEAGGGTSARKARAAGEGKGPRETEKSEATEATEIL